MSPLFTQQLLTLLFPYGGASSGNKVRDWEAGALEGAGSIYPLKSDVSHGADKNLKSPVSLAHKQLFSQDTGQPLKRPKWAGETAQLVRCLPCKHNNQNSISRMFLERGCGGRTRNASTREVDTDRSLGFTGSQPSLLGKF